MEERKENIGATVSKPIWQEWKFPLEDDTWGQRSWNQMAEVLEGQDKISHCVLEAVGGFRGVNKGVVGLSIQGNKSSQNIMDQTTSCYAHRVDVSGI